MQQFEKLFEHNRSGPWSSRTGSVSASRDPGQAQALSHQHADFYVARAKGGCGLIMVGGHLVAASSLGGRPCARGRGHIPPLASCKAVHELSRTSDRSRDRHLGGQMYRSVTMHSDMSRRALPLSSFGYVPANRDSDQGLVTSSSGGQTSQDAGFDLYGHGAHGYGEHFYLLTQRRTVGGASKSPVAANHRGIRAVAGKGFPF